MTATTLTFVSGRRGTLLLLVTAAGIGAGWLAGGAGYVLDDWFLLGNAEVDGITGVGNGDIGSSRPGSAVVYALVFSVLAGHPSAGLVLAVAVSTATALLLRALLARFVDDGWAVVAGLLWLVLPNHTSLEYWLTCLPLGIAAMLVLLVALLVSGDTTSPRRWALAVAITAIASLTYEAAAPAGFLALVLMPRARGSWPSRPRVVGAAVVAVACAGYLAVFKNSVKSVGDVAPLHEAVPAHFGWGIAPDAFSIGSVLLLVAVSVGMFCVVRAVRPASWGAPGEGERVALAGLVVVAVGALPFVTYAYSPLGTGDRVTLISALGGATAWAGLCMVAARWRPALGVGLVAVLLLAGTAARVPRMSNWVTAAADGERIVAAIEDRWPDGPPSGRVVLGPTPIRHQRVAAFLDPSNVDGAVRFLYGAPAIVGDLTYSADEFAEIPEDERLDIRPHSRLEPDSVVVDPLGNADSP